MLLEHFVVSQIRLLEVITSQLQIWSAWPALCRLVTPRPRSVSKWGRWCHALC